MLGGRGRGIGYVLLSGVARVSIVGAGFVTVTPVVINDINTAAVFIASDITVRLLINIM